MVLSSDPLTLPLFQMEMKNCYFKFPLFWEADGYFLHLSINDNYKQESLIKQHVNLSFSKTSLSISSLMQSIT